MERLGANLPVMRSFPLSHHPSYPHIAKWFAALNERPAYQRVKSDDMTHNLVFRCNHHHGCLYCRLHHLAQEMMDPEHDVGLLANPAAVTGLKLPASCLDHTLVFLPTASLRLLEDL